MEEINVEDLIAELRELKMRVARLEGVSESVMNSAVRDMKVGDQLQTVQTIKNPATRELKVGDRLQIKNRVWKP